METNSFYEGAAFATLVSAICRSLEEDMNRGASESTDAFRLDLQRFKGLLVEVLSPMRVKPAWGDTISGLMGKASEKERALLLWARRVGQLTNSQSVPRLVSVLAAIVTLVDAVIDGNVTVDGKELLMRHLAGLSEQLLNGPPATPPVTLSA